jgi:hypothetical protein
VIFIWIGGAQLGIDIESALLALMVLGLLAWFVIAALRRDRLQVTIAGLAVVAGSMSFVYRSLVTPSASWPVMYAAVTEVRGDERRQRAAELLPLWHFGQVRRVDWFLLSRRWGVCHRMWEQVGCRPPKGHWEAEGFVRELVYKLPMEDEHFYAPLR